MVRCFKALACEKSNVLAQIPFMVVTTTEPTSLQTSGNEQFCALFYDHQVDAVPLIKPFCSKVVQLHAAKLTVLSSRVADYHCCPVWLLTTSAAQSVPELPVLSSPVAKLPLLPSPVAKLPVLPSPVADYHCCPVWLLNYQCCPVWLLNYQCSPVRLLNYQCSPVRLLNYQCCPVWLLNYQCCPVWLLTTTAVQFGC